RRHALAGSQDDGQPRLAVEIFAKPSTLTDGANDGADRGAVPAELRDAPVVRDRMQLEIGILGIWEAEHRSAREYLLEQRAPGDCDLIERRGIFALQVNADRPRRAADATEQIPFGGKDAGIGQSGGDGVADEPLEFADASLIHHACADGAAAGPRQDVPVLQTRLALA